MIQMIEENFTYQFNSHLLSSLYINSWYKKP